MTDPLLRLTGFGYDANHLLLTVTDPNQGLTTNVYDGSGRVTQQTDPANLVTHFAYAGDNYSAGGGTTTITDPHGSITVENFANGLMTSENRCFRNIDRRHLELPVRPEHLRHDISG